MLPFSFPSHAVSINVPIRKKKPLAEIMIGLIGETVKYAFTQVRDRAHAVEPFNFNDLSSGTYVHARHDTFVSDHHARNFAISIEIAGSDPYRWINNYNAARNFTVAPTESRADVIPDGVARDTVAKLRKLLIRADEKLDPGTVAASVLRSRENFMADRLSSSNRIG